MILHTSIYSLDRNVTSFASKVPNPHHVQNNHHDEERDITTVNKLHHAGKEEDHFNTTKEEDTEWQLCYHTDLSCTLKQNRRH